MSGAIINGTYYPDGQRPQTSRVNSQHKAWNLDEQRRVHAADIIQAHKGGKPNPDFIREYPEEASRYFTPEQIREWGNAYNG